MLIYNPQKKVICPHGWLNARIVHNLMKHPTLFYMPQSRVIERKQLEKIGSISEEPSEEAEEKEEEEDGGCSWVGGSRCVTCTVVL